jgi:hypothetical protein
VPLEAETWEALRSAAGNAGLDQARIREITG